MLYIYASGYIFIFFNNNNLIKLMEKMHMDFIGSLSPWLRVIINSTLAFITIFIISRIEGKKTIAQMQLIDYVVGITIGSIAAQMTIDEEIPFYLFILAMVMFLLLSLIVSSIERKANILKFILRGKPDVIIENGKINAKALNKSKLDVNELLALCRQKSYFDINDIAFAVFETSGELSILPKANKSPVVAEDVGANPPKASLSQDVIIDGQIVEACLVNIGKDRNWLFEKLSISDESEIKKYILATYDEEKDQIICHKH